MPVTPETLFQTLFWPLYPEDVRNNLAHARKTDANPANNPAVLAHLDEAAAVFQSMATRIFGEDLRLDRSDASVHRLSRALTKERCDAWASEGAAGTEAHSLFNVVVHGAAYVGACVVREHAGVWNVRRPLWESLVSLTSRAGEAQLAPFHWWLKSLSEATLDGETSITLADRYRAHVEIPCATHESLPTIAPTERRIPRLAKVRYDTLHKHLRSHLPELRDLGEHFPSPERWAAYGFEWLDFTLLSGGKMLLMHGPGKGGVHLFWLDQSGFDKAALFPADGFPAPVLKVEGGDDSSRLVCAGCPADS